MQHIVQIARELAEVRGEINSIKDTLKPIELKRDQLQAQLIELMQENKLKSIKTKDVNFARVLKKDFKVINELALIEELKVRNEYENYVKPKIDLIGLKAYQNSLLKGTGEILSGIEPVETEYMSIKSLTKTNPN